MITCLTCGELTGDAQANCCEHCGAPIRIRCLVCKRDLMAEWQRDEAREVARALLADVEEEEPDLATDMKRRFPWLAG